MNTISPSIPPNIPQEKSSRGGLPPLLLLGPLVVLGVEVNLLLRVGVVVAVVLVVKLVKVEFDAAVVRVVAKEGGQAGGVPAKGGSPVSTLVAEERNPDASQK